MAEAKAEKLFDIGFCILLENCQDSRGKHWACSYISKFSGENAVEISEPKRLELMEKIQRLLLECGRVELLSKSHPVGSERHQLIRDLQGYYPEMKVVGMTYL